MVLNVYYNGKLKATVVDDNILFKQLNDEFSQLMEDNITSIQEEEDEWGNVTFVKHKNSLNKKLTFLKSLGFEFKEEQIKSLTKEAKLEDGEDIVDEAQEYDDFLTRKFSKWEKEVLSMVELELSDTLNKDIKLINKSFGAFLSRLFNIVNTSDFADQLRQVINRKMKEGMQEAENELNIDIGVDNDFKDEVNQQVDRQLNGFHINDKFWPGLKGVAEDVQNDIMGAVTDGVANKEGLAEVTKNIQIIFAKQKGGSVDGEEFEGRAIKIARTESSRLINQSKIDAYKKTGIVKKKKWDAYFDNRTSEICKRLNGQEVDLNGYFVDPLTGRKFQQPPETHPNCRCTLTPVV